VVETFVPCATDDVVEAHFDRAPWARTVSHVVDETRSRWSTLLQARNPKKAGPFNVYAVGDT
jgi:hypothetical protein